MKIVTVYRVDYMRKTRVAIGWVAERRQKERGDNLLGLLRLARKIYGTGASEALYVTVWTPGGMSQPYPDHVVASSDRQLG